MAVSDGRMVGTLTLHLNEWEGKPAWQLRGMAVTPQMQGASVGTGVKWVGHSTTGGLFSVMQQGNYTSLTDGVRFKAASPGYQYISATQISKEPDGTSKASTVMDATATPMSMGSNMIHCSTTGELEKRVNEVLATRLNLRK